MYLLINLCLDDEFIIKALTSDGIPVPTIPNGANTFSQRCKFSNGNRALIVVQMGFEAREGEEPPNGYTMFWVADDLISDEDAYQAMAALYDKLLTEGKGVLQ